MSRPSQVVVLAEDERHVRFARQHLYRMGHAHHDIRVEELPSGRGCGEQWVRERYARAVKAYRARSARAETALMVVIDADTGDVDRRQFQGALDEAGVAACTGGEAIAHLVPKRNIETWVLCLSGRHVDEDADCRTEAGIDVLIAASAATFFAWSRVNITPPAHCVPSLLAAIPEVRRLG
jgi:hypothetical protein